MASGRLHAVLRELHLAAQPRAWTERTDGQLMRAFIERRDQAAFEMLMRRHGPMVLGVCRRLLHRHHDAEDAFQATFLVLARKASSVVPREMVGNWLHGVAYQTARKARAFHARRDGRERQVPDMPDPPARPADPWPDLQPLLDEELGQLPDKYRVPIVLCDLEGKTHKEAAHQLGWPQGTVAGRLARGRALLARRLTRRGVTLSAGSLALVLPGPDALARVPAALTASTARAATLWTAGQIVSPGLISTRVILLTEGVLKAMLVAKLRGVFLALLLVALLGTVVGTVGALGPQQTGDDPNIVPQPISVAPPRPGEPRPEPLIRPAPTGVGLPAGPVQKEFVVQVQIMEMGADDVSRVESPRFQIAVQKGKTEKAVGLIKQRIPVLGKIKFVDRLFETVKTGVTYEVKVEELGPDHALLNLTLHKNDVEHSDDDGTLVWGRTLQIMRRIKLGKLERFALEKDAEGKPTSWVEVSVVLDSGATPIIVPGGAPQPPARGR